MSKLIHLTAWFMLGCISSSFVAWLGKIHPALFKVAALIYGLTAILLGLSVVLDDAIIKYFSMQSENYYGVIIAVSVSVIVGLIITVL